MNKKYTDKKYKKINWKLLLVYIVTGTILSAILLYFLYAFGAFS